MNHLPATLADLVFTTLGHVPTAQEPDLRERLRQDIAHYTLKCIQRDGGFFPAYQAATVHQEELRRTPGQQPFFDSKVYFTQNISLQEAQKCHHIKDPLIPAVLRYFPNQPQNNGLALAPSSSKVRNFKLFYISPTSVAKYLSTLFTLKPDKWRSLLHLNEPYTLLLRQEGSAFGRPAEWKSVFPSP